MNVISADYSQQETAALNCAFGVFLKTKTWPKSDEIKNVINSNPVLQNRTVEKITSWLQYRINGKNQQKKEKHQKKTDYSYYFLRNSKN